MFFLVFNVEQMWPGMTLKRLKPGAVPMKRSASACNILDVALPIKQPRFHVINEVGQNV
jgi:hypothetical protein